MGDGTLQLRLVRCATEAHQVLRERFGQEPVNAPDVTRALDAIGSVYQAAFDEVVRRHSRSDLLQAAVRRWGRAAWAATEPFYEWHKDAYETARNDTNFARAQIELLLRAPLGGDDAVTSSIEEELLELTVAVQQTAIFKAYADSGGFVVTLSADPAEVVIDAHDPPGFAMSRWLNERDADLMRESRGYNEGLAKEVMKMHELDRPLPAALAELNPLVRTTFRVRFDTLIRVLMVLSQEAPDPGDLGISSAGSLAELLTERLSEARPAPGAEQIRAALDLLTLRAGSFRDRPYDPARARAAVPRVLLHPVVAVTDPPPRLWKQNTLIWAKWPVVEALEDYANSVIHGVWPEQLAPSQPGRAELQRWLAAYKGHGRLGRGAQLEKVVADEIRRSGLPVAWNLLPRESPPRLRNQIDVLAADPAHDRLWVLSVKDRTPSLAPRNTSLIRAQFFRDTSESHRAKLDRMVADVAADPPAFAARTGVSTPNRVWQARGAFVPRSSCPAAYDERADGIPFLQLHDVASYLSGGEPYM